MAVKTLHNRAETPALEGAEIWGQIYGLSLAAGRLKYEDFRQPAALPIHKPDVNNNGK